MIVRATTIGDGSRLEASGGRALVPQRSPVPSVGESRGFHFETRVRSRALRAGVVRRGLV